VEYWEGLQEQSNPAGIGVVMGPRLLQQKGMKLDIKLPDYDSGSSRKSGRGKSWSDKAKSALSCQDQLLLGSSCRHPMQRGASIAWWCQEWPSQAHHATTPFSSCQASIHPQIILCFPLRPRLHYRATMPTFSFASATPPKWQLPLIAENRISLRASAHLISCPARTAYAPFQTTHPTASRSPQRTRTLPQVAGEFFLRLPTTARLNAPFQAATLSFPGFAAGDSAQRLQVRYEGVMGGDTDERQPGTLLRDR
jgi:hypothetical protein